ncbi:MAG: serine--tRNA ligase [Clostridiales bacterium]|nr:serine--tRNA ligase [Clostridiales bacterium]
MLDVKFIRNNPEAVTAALLKRGGKISLEGFLTEDAQRRGVLARSEELKARRNAISKLVGRGGDGAEALKAEAKELGEQIAVLDEELRGIEESIERLMLQIPNMPHESVLPGADESGNTEVRRVGTPRSFAFEPKAHWDLGEALDILDFGRAAKISGARFTVYKGLGARLERALINFFLDFHGKNGYTEVFPPFMVNSASMRGTGQLPKFQEDMFRVEGTDYYLIPTAEVPLTNLYSGEILSEKDLPIHLTAYSACFRAEAGAAGRDTRGLIRQHQFNKVELVKFCLPEESYAELESLTAEAEAVLQALELPYRVVCLCGGDMGFCAAKTYDLEVWLPSFNGYKEISSCSNCTDFQARRANIRFRRAGGKPEFVHTLNGSGVAVGRAVTAILENCQQEDGSIRLPKALVPYMGVEVIGSER